MNEPSTGYQGFVWMSLLQNIKDLYEWAFYRISRICNEPSTEYQGFVWMSLLQDIKDLYEWAFYRISRICNEPSTEYQGFVWMSLLQNIKELYSNSWGYPIIKLFFRFRFYFENPNTNYRKIPAMSHDIISTKNLLLIWKVMSGWARVILYECCEKN